MDRERFSANLKKIVETDTGYKAELRIFVSKGERFYLCDYAGRILAMPLCLYLSHQICVCPAVMDCLSLVLAQARSPWQPLIGRQHWLWSLHTPELWIRREV